MDYNKATLHAATGRTLLLPGWRGYFYWDYSKKELNFRNGDYHLDNKQLREKGVMERTDWYYITKQASLEIRFAYFYLTLYFVS